MRKEEGEEREGGRERVRKREIEEESEGRESVSCGRE